MPTNPLGKTLVLICFFIKGFAEVLPTLLPTLYSITRNNTYSYYCTKPATLLCSPSRTVLYICTPMTRINFALHNSVLFAYRISNSATIWLLARRFAAIVYASCSLGGAALFPLSRLPLLIQTLPAPLPALQLATDTASFSHTE